MKKKIIDFDHKEQVIMHQINCMLTILYNKRNQVLEEHARMNEKIKAIVERTSEDELLSSSSSSVSNIYNRETIPTPVNTGEYCGDSTTSSDDDYLK